MDGDLHKQEIRPLLVTDGKEPDSVDLPGLIDCLENPNICLEDCLTNAPGMKFKFLSGNAADSTRSRLHAFDKKTIASFFEKLKEQFDYIILDTPPCGIVSDSGILCHYADSVIYVVKQDYAGRSQILDGINSLSDKNAPLTGCIINGISGTSHRYGYGYGYKYGYGYGYGYGHKYGYGKKSGYGYGNTEDDDANSESKDE